LTSSLFYLLYTNILSIYRGEKTAIVIITIILSFEYYLEMASPLKITAKCGKVDLHFLIGIQKLNPQFLVTLNSINKCES
jgi:hypothetical protein